MGGIAVARGPLSLLCHQGVACSGLLLLAVALQVRRVL